MTTEGHLESAQAGGAWFYGEEGGTRSGPLTTSAMQAMLREGQLKAETLIWRPGLANWIPLGDVVAEILHPTASTDSVQEATPPPRPSPSTGYRWSWRPGMTPEETPSIPPEIGGWLYLLWIGIAMSTLYCVIGTIVLWTIMPWLGIDMSVVLILLPLDCVYLSYVSWLFAHKRRATRTALVVLLCVNAIVTMCWPESGSQVAAAWLYAAIWIAYLYRSKRVRATFIT